MVGYAPFGHGNFPSSNSDDGRGLVKIAEIDMKKHHDQVVLKLYSQSTF